MKGGNDRRKAVSLLNLAMRLSDLEARGQQLVPGEQSPPPLQATVYRMNLFHAGFLRNAEFAIRLPSEVLHCVGDIDLLPVDIRFFEALAQ